MSVLTESGRDRMKKKQFVFPKTRQYPIHDRAHARQALARSSQFGSKHVQAKVRAKVKSKYPGIELTSASKPSKTTVKQVPIGRYSHTDKEKKSAMEIEGTTLRAMADELALIHKEAMLKEAIWGRIASGLGTVGSKALGLAGKGAKRLGYGKQFGQLRGQAGRAVGGQQRLGQLVGGAGALGAGAAGAGFLAGRASKRPQPRGY